jgi:hypothetical protein
MWRRSGGAFETTWPASSSVKIQMFMSSSRRVYARRSPEREIAGPITSSPKVVMRSGFPPEAEMRQSELTLLPRRDENTISRLSDVQASPSIVRPSNVSRFGDHPAGEHSIHLFRRPEAQLRIRAE